MIKWEESGFFFEIKLNVVEIYENKLFKKDY